MYGSLTYLLLFFFSYRRSCVLFRKYFAVESIRDFIKQKYWVPIRYKEMFKKYYFIMKG